MVLDVDCELSLKPFPFPFNLYSFPFPFPSPAQELQRDGSERAGRAAGGDALGRDEAGGHAVQLVLTALQMRCDDGAEAC
jgi:hypothetical protein